MGLGLSNQEIIPGWFWKNLFFSAPYEEPDLDVLGHRIEYEDSVSSHDEVAPPIPDYGAGPQYR